MHVWDSKRINKHYRQNELVRKAAAALISSSAATSPTAREVEPIPEHPTTTTKTAMPLSPQSMAAAEHGDLEDLLPPSAANGHTNGSNGNGHMNGNGNGMPSKSFQSGGTNGGLVNIGYTLCSALSYLYAHLAYAYHYRRTEFFLGSIFVFCTLLAFSGALTPSWSKKGKGYHSPAILHDWSQVSSALDLKIGGIDHWCLRGDNDQCRCEDPTIPSPRSEVKAWGHAHSANKKAVGNAVAKTKEAETEGRGSDPTAPWGGGFEDDEAALAWYEEGYEDDWIPDYAIEDGGDGDGRQRQLDGVDAATGAGAGAGASSKAYPLDVVFLGDSITEQRTGRFYGRPKDELKGKAKVFRNHFSREAGAKYEGLALGVAGDTSPTLLWRLLHGEMPDDLNPKIWWITIGSNDLGATQCSEEVTLLGILRVVEEILKQKPESRIVINSILPMSQEKSGILEIKGKPYQNKRKRNAVNFWPSIKAVNRQLQKFADRHKSVKFFDATDIFTEVVGNRLVIDHTLMEDGVHPTPAGYKKWDAEIIKRIDTIETKDGAKKTAAAAAKVAEAAREQDQMDAAAADAVTDDGYSSYDEEERMSGEDFYDDDLYFAFDGDGDGDDAWLYAGATDDWR